MDYSVKNLSQLRPCKFNGVVRLPICRRFALPCGGKVLMAVLSLRWQGICSLILATGLSKGYAGEVLPMQR